jgi:hypothetical protein
VDVEPRLRACWLGNAAPRIEREHGIDERSTPLLRDGAARRG